MGDNFYEPERLTIGAGETVRFVLKNDGEFLHEFNLSTAAMHAAHQKEMMTMMEQGVLTPTGLDHSKMKMGESSAAMDHNPPTLVSAPPFTPATNAHLLCRPLLDASNQPHLP